ncbi:hypothetical protein HIM_09405 [Hirsutella minnesotensis 3608]|uniref:Uncharacterized protein n=1 Tax=Hirsutella minnesotensis 3608 TaxID=1043627 RepID=A0A0F8A347_9HYPO|nr:hypothetical protein HIM_09405 [Hirsutella minnesotensis 3608]
MPDHDGGQRGSGGGNNIATKDGDNDRDKGKGRETDSGASMGERLLASSTMAFNAMAGGSTMLDAPPEQKASGAGPSTSAQLATTRAEASTLRRAPGISESLRAPGRGDDAAQAYDSFVNAKPRPAPAPPQEETTLSHDSTFGSIDEQEANDGAAVVQLLAMDDDPADLLLENHFDDLTPDEAARLREALFGASSPGSRNPQWDELLSFVPGSISRPGETSSADTQRLVGTADAGLAQSIWLEQWSSVLSSYTDEVWGDLGPLAAEAKREVDGQVAGDAHAGQGSSDKKALGRLRLILAHLRGGA